MKALFCAAVLALGTVAIASEEMKFGAGVTLKEATPIKALVEKPGDYVGKTIRIDGVATSVCEEMGCWMAIAAENDPRGTTVRLNVLESSIRFPVTAKGKKVSAEGVFEQVGGKDDHAHPAAGAHANHQAASKKYEIKATGAIVK